MNLTKIINKICYAFFISMFIIFFVGVLAQVYNSYIINNSGNVSDIDTTDEGVLIFSDPELS